MILATIYMSGRKMACKLLLIVTREDSGTAIKEIEFTSKVAADIAYDNLDKELTASSRITWYLIKLY